MSSTAPIVIPFAGDYVQRRRSRVFMFARQTGRRGFGPMAVLGQSSYISVPIEQLPRQHDRELQLGDLVMQDGRVMGVVTSIEGGLATLRPQLFPEVSDEVQAQIMRGEVPVGEPMIGASMIVTDSQTGQITRETLRDALAIMPAVGARQPPQAEIFDVGLIESLLAEGRRRSVADLQEILPRIERMVAPLRAAVAAGSESAAALLRAADSILAVGNELVRPAVEVRQDFQPVPPRPPVPLGQVVGNLAAIDRIELADNPAPVFMDVSTVRQPADRVRGIRADQVILDDVQDLDGPAAISVPLGFLPTEQYIEGRRYLVEFDRLAPGETAEMRAAFYNTELGEPFRPPLAQPYNVEVEQHGHQVWLRWQCDDAAVRCYLIERVVDDGDWHVAAVIMGWSGQHLWRDLEYGAGMHCYRVTSLRGRSRLTVPESHQISNIITVRETLVDAMSQRWFHRVGSFHQTFRAWMGGFRGAIDSINDFTRRRMRDDGFYRRILPPLAVGNDELDRAVPTDRPVRVP